MIRPSEPRAHQHVRDTVATRQGERHLVSYIPTQIPAFSPRQRRRFLVRTLLTASGTALVVLLLYYVLPIDSARDSLIFLVLGIELAILAVVVGWQVRRVLRSSTPLLAAIEALAFTVPLFLVVFAAMYVGLSANSGTNFNVGTLTRTDGLYFTVTVFATVGFGDITATSQLTRALVTAQMLLDLVVLGLLIRVFIGAVQEAWRLKGSPTPDQLRDHIAESVDEGSGLPQPSDGA
ncbi:MAG TPA: potassium channel family protein [Candidatus Nanopelagicales bacterium]|nr:potassium channel family protein [Candidatus Nanopelagicales bacterium]